MLKFVSCLSKTDTLPLVYLWIPYFGAESKAFKCWLAKRTLGQKKKENNSKIITHWGFSDYAIVGGWWCFVAAGGVVFLLKDSQ